MNATFRYVAKESYAVSSLPEKPSLYQWYDKATLQEIEELIAWLEECTAESKHFDGSQYSRILNEPGAMSLLGVCRCETTDRTSIDCSSATLDCLIGNTAETWSNSRGMPGPLRAVDGPSCARDHGAGFPFPHGETEEHPCSWGGVLLMQRAGTNGTCGLVVWATHIDWTLTLIYMAIHVKFWWTQGPLFLWFTLEPYLVWAAKDYGVAYALRNHNH